MKSNLSVSANPIMSHCRGGLARLASAKLALFIGVFFAFGCLGGEALECPRSQLFGLTAGFSPGTFELAPGGSRSINVHLTKTTVFQGLRAYTIAGDGGLVFSPATLEINWGTQNDETQSRTVTVTAVEGAPAGSVNFWLSDSSGARIANGTASITSSGGEATFLFTRAPSSVAMENEVNSSPVTFTVTPIAGFSGSVRIHYAADEYGVAQVPSDNDFDINVPAGGNPVTFSRQYFRPYGAAPIIFTYTATYSAATSITRSVTVTVNAI